MSIRLSHLNYMPIYRTNKNEHNWSLRNDGEDLLGYADEEVKAALHHELDEEREAEGVRNLSRNSIWDQIENRSNGCSSLWRYGGTSLRSALPLRTSAAWSELQAHIINGEAKSAVMYSAHQIYNIFNASLVFRQTIVGECKTCWIDQHNLANALLIFEAGLDGRLFRHQLGQNCATMFDSRTPPS